MSEVFTCDKGAFALTGYSVSFITEMSLAKGAFALTGYSLAMVPALVATKGAFALTGHALTLTAAERLTCATGSFALTGYDLTLSEPGRLTCATAHFRISGYILKDSEHLDLDKSVTTTLTIGGSSVDPERVRIGIEEGGFWVAEITLTNATDYALAVYDAAVVLTIGSQAWTLSVDRKGRNRESSMGGIGETWTVYAISDAADYDTPRATTITQTWGSADAASAIADDLLGSVSWGIYDWTVPAGRFAIDSAIPIAAARQLVEEIGGILRIEPDASISAVYEFPYASNRIATAPADITLTERHNLRSMNETLDVGKPVNSVRVYNSDGSALASAADQMQWIPDDDNPLHGTMRVTASPWRSGLSLLCRDTGVVIGNGAVTLTDVEDEPIIVSYGIADTQYPIGPSLTSYSVDGNVSSTLARDEWGSTGITASEDTLIFSAVVSYKRLTLDFEITFPDYGDYLVQVQDDESDQGVGIIDIVCTRGTGDTPGPDVLAPLISDEQGAKLRAQAEIDRTARHEIRTVSCDYQPTIRAGWIVRSKDTQLDEWWQAKTEAVRHVAEKGTAHTELDLWRPI